MDRNPPGGYRLAIPAPHPSPDRANAPSLTYVVKQLELAVRRELDRAVRPFGLTTPQYTALSVLAEHPGISSAELARRSFVSPQAASQMVVALEGKGLVVRMPPTDQRVIALNLSGAGRATLGRCSGPAREIERRMLDGIDGDGRATIRALLSQCLRSLQSGGQPVSPP